MTPLLSSLSTDQSKALDRLLEWLKKPTSRFITLGGYAGTGKTTLISLLRQELARQGINKKIAYAAYTGKASQVLRSYLEDGKVLGPYDTCGTIHSLLYSPEIDGDGRILSWKRSKTISADLIIVDEASMVTESLWTDLLCTDKPIIALGDHGQLPPIGSSFNLMEKPDITLEEIHRQAKDNPIIQLAHEARLSGVIEAKKYGDGILKMSHATHDSQEINELIDDLLGESGDDRLLLCGRNKTRIQLNQAVRRKQERENEPESGDRVVCLKNDYRHVLAPIYNGMVGTIEHIEPHGDHWYDAEIDFPEEGRRFEGLICKSQFSNPLLVENVKGVDFKDVGGRFDFGYALTVHKAQGSQAETVVLFEERFIKSNDEEWRRWLYTAVTRAKERLYIFAA